MEENQYRIGELAEKAGVTKRTIHYYMGRGLLPPPEGAGLGTTYSDEHLYRIMLVRKLQDAWLPLDEIKKRINGMRLDEVKAGLAPGEPVVMEDSYSYRSPAMKTPGTTYERIMLGLGVELHYPSGNERSAELAEKLIKYAENIMKEG